MLKPNGNGSSVYLTVEAGTVDESENPDDAITDVVGLYTGVQSVDIELTGNIMDNNTDYDNDYNLSAGRIAGTIESDGRTLYTNTGDVGLAVASGAKAVVVQDEGAQSNLERKVRPCGSVAEAIGMLADANSAVSGKQYAGRVVAVLNSAGMAQWVAFVSDTPLVAGGGISGNVPAGDFEIITDLGGSAYELRYYGDKTDAQKKAYAEEIMTAFAGAPVKAFNFAAKKMTFDDGTLFGTTVTITFKQVYAIKLGSRVLKYVDKGVRWGAISNLPDGDYMWSNVTAAAVGGLINNTKNLSTLASRDVAVVPAYAVTLSGVTAAYKDADGNDQAYRCPDLYTATYKAKNTDITIVFSTAP